MMTFLIDVTVAGIVALVLLAGVYGLATDTVQVGERTREQLMARVALINLEGEWRLLTPEERVELLASPSVCASGEVREGGGPQRMEDWCAALVEVFSAHGEPVLACLSRLLPSGAMRATIAWGEDWRSVAADCDAIAGPSDFREWV
jgi:hypothetical protein